MLDEKELRRSRYSRGHRHGIKSGQSLSRHVTLRAETESEDFEDYEPHPPPQFYIPPPSIQELCKPPADAAEYVFTRLQDPPARMQGIYEHAARAVNVVDRCWEAQRGFGRLDPVTEHAVRPLSTQANPELTAQLNAARDQGLKSIRIAVTRDGERLRLMHKYRAEIEALLTKPKGRGRGRRTKGRRKGRALLFAQRRAAERSPSPPRDTHRRTWRAACSARYRRRGCSCKMCKWVAPDPLQKHAGLELRVREHRRGPPRVAAPVAARTAPATSPDTPRKPTHLPPRCWLAVLRFAGDLSRGLTLSRGIAALVRAQVTRLRAPPKAAPLLARWARARHLAVDNAQAALPRLLAVDREWLAQLRVLDLTRNGLEDDAALALADAVGNGLLPSLRELRLRGNPRLSADALRRLADALRLGAPVPRLRVVDVGECAAWYEVRGVATAFLLAVNSGALPRLALLGADAPHHPRLSPPMDAPPAFVAAVQEAAARCPGFRLSLRGVRPQLPEEVMAGLRTVLVL